MRRHFLKQNKRIRLKRKKMMTKAGLLVVALLFIFLGLVWGAHNERVRITNVYTEGNSVVLDREVREIVDTQMEGKYFRVFPKDNIFIHPRWQIKQKIFDKFKRIYYVKVSVIDFNSIAITVKERDPYALWCVEELSKNKKNTASSCYFIDDKGFAFTKSPAFSDNVYFTVYSDSLVENPNELLGKNFLNEKRFVRLMQLRSLLVKEGLDVTHLTQGENDDFEFYLVSGGKLMFNEYQDIEKLLHNLVAAIEVKKSEGQKIGEDLEYIDVRFNNKVLFKFNS